MALRDRLYVPLLTRMLHYRWSVIVLIGLSVMGCMLCLTKLPFTLFPPAQDQFGYVTVNRYVGDTMNQFHNKVNQVQHEIQNTIATTYMVKTVGVGFPRVNYSMPANTQDPDSAQLFFKISGPRSDKQAQIERIKSKLFQLPFSDAISVQSFLFNQSTAFPITIEIGGDEHDQVSQVAKALVTKIQSHEQVMGVLSSSADHHIRLNYTLNTREIIANSLDLEEVRLAVQLLISGKYVMTLYNDVDDQVSVILSINGETGNGQSTSLHDQLRQVVLVNSKGHTFPLSELVSFNLKSMPKSQWVSNDQSTVILTVQVQDATAISTLVESIQQQVNAIEMNAPVSIQIKSEAQNIQDNFMKFGSVALFFIGLIFSILVVVFQSFLMPLIIFTVLPISFLGGSLGLLMTGQSVTLFAFLGFVSLSGIVINDSILLIDAFKKHCDDSPSSSHQQPDLHASLVLSAASRFIPVNTTSITTILSVLPLALDKTLFQPLAVVLIGGLSLSTVVILLTVPALLCWAESKR
jgi:multidrug efflux pump subunit AcrB